MPDNHRQERAESLRHFLLSQALANQLDDEILEEALAIIKLPTEFLNINQITLDQLLDEWQAGHINTAEFNARWLHIIEEIQQGHKPESQRRPISKATHIPNWIAYLLLSGLAVSAFAGWLAYQAGLFQQLIPPPASANTPPPEPVKTTEKETPKACPTCAKPQPAAQETPKEANTHWPADYPIKAYVAEGFALAEPAKLAVAAYFQSNGVYPRSNAQIGLAPPTDIHSDAVSSVAVGEGGIIAVTYNKLVGKGQTLILQPSSAGGGPIVWDCKKGSVPSLYRPPHCR